MHASTTGTYDMVVSSGRERTQGHCYLLCHKRPMTVTVGFTSTIGNFVQKYNKVLPNQNYLAYYHGSVDSSGIYILKGILYFFLTIKLGSHPSHTPNVSPPRRFSPSENKVESNKLSLPPSLVPHFSSDSTDAALVCWFRIIRL